MNIGFDPNRKAMAVSDWRELHFVGSKPPCIRTIKKWIDDPEDLETVGYNKGSMYFIYIDTREDEEALSILSELGYKAA